MSDLVAAVVAALAAALLGALAPRLVRALPEPPERPEEEKTERDLAEGPKEPYVSIARLAWFAPSAMGASAVAAGLIGWTVGWSWLLVGLVPLVPVVVALSIVDLRTKLLPARVVLPTTGAMIVLATLHAGLVADWDDLWRGLVAMVAGRSFYWVLWFIHSAGLGFGDVRLAALLGLVLGYLGWPELLVGLYAGFLVLAVPGVVLALVKRKRSYLKTQFPFGPFMAVGALIGIVAGQPIIESLVGL